MPYLPVQATHKIFNLKKRIRAVCGGTSASKTISILIWLIDYCQTAKDQLASVVSESFPHLKRGAMRDFLSIMESQGYYQDSCWNKTDFIYTFPNTNSKLEFFSADQPGKVRGPRRDVLFINEANNIPYETYTQLEVRTKKIIWLDWNPTNEFWYYTEIQQMDHDFITLTYKDNEALDQRIVQAIEARKSNKNWWRVYGEGQLGEVEGKIYKDWATIDTIPHEARLERYGLDFGYSNDPSAIVAVYKYNGGFILDEILFQKGMSNKQLADVLLNEPKALVIADSAEPKSIDEIMSYGVPVQPSTKGQGSVGQGIQFVQDQRVSVTKRSLNVLKEYRNYLWKTDKDGKILNIPDVGFDHCFHPDTEVWTTDGKRRIENLVGKSGYVYSRGGQIKRFGMVRPTRKNAEIVEITFDDGDCLKVTPDHLLLQTDGTWIESGLLRLNDLIQSVTYEYDNRIRQQTGFQWNNILSLRHLFQKQSAKAKEPAQSSLDISQRENTKGLSHSSYRSQQSKQPDRKPRVNQSCSSSFISHDIRTQEETKEILSKCASPTCCEVAWVKRGNRVSQVAWKEKLGEQKVVSNSLRSLWKRTLNSISKSNKVLPLELQNESKTKKIVGITRGFAKVTYNLEVEDTHCFIANGVVVHNSMDAARYAIVSTTPNTVPLDSLPQFNSYVDEDLGL